MKRSAFRRIFVAMFSLVLSLGLLVHDADARRMGGGRSFGRQAPAMMQRQAPPAAPQYNSPSAQPRQQPAPAQPAPAQPPRSRWGGMLGGLAAGLGLGYLFSHMGGGMMGGLVSSLAGLLMIGLLAAALVWMFRKFSGSGNQPAYAGTPPYAMPEARPVPPPSYRAADPVWPDSPSSQPLASAVPALDVPVDFDRSAFLRFAKVTFIRLQAAWDKGDLEDIRQYTTPEMYAEIKLDLSDRQGVNQTDVVSVEAELLGCERQGDYYLASILFSGMLREAADAPAAPFKEIWNFSKTQDGRGDWLLSGIQQVDQELNHK